MRQKGNAGAWTRGMGGKLIFEYSYVPLNHVNGLLIKMLDYSQPESQPKKRERENKMLD